MASTAGGLAAGASSNPSIRTRVSHRGSPPNKIMLPLMRGATKKMWRAPSPTDLWLDPVISQRTQSSDLSVVVGLFVYGWCACVVWVWVCTWADNTAVPRWEASKKISTCGFCEIFYRGGTSHSTGTLLSTDFYFPEISLESMITYAKSNVENLTN